MVVPRFATIHESENQEKWSNLVGRVVSVSSVAWPCKLLLKYREEAMQEALEEMHWKSMKGIVYRKGHQV